MIQIRLELADGGRRDYRFSRSVVNVGRSPLNDLEVDDRAVSVRHGVLRLKEGRLAFEDRDSVGGTTLLREGTSQALQGVWPVGPGDVLVLGGSARIVILDAEEHSTLGDRFRHLPWPDEASVPPSARPALDALTESLLLRPDRIRLMNGAAAVFAAGLNAEILELGTLRDLTRMPAVSVLSSGTLQPGALGVAAADHERLLTWLRAGGMVHHPHADGHRVFLGGPNGGDDNADALMVHLRASRYTEDDLVALGRPLVPLIVAVGRHERTQEIIATVEAENDYFKDRQRRHYLFKELVTDSPVMKRLYHDLNAMVDSPAPVLLAGEAGTGKQMVARALHHLGPRQAGLLVTGRCGGDPAALAVELFGTAARGDEPARPGIFELANGGTVYLDETGRLPNLLQARLLRMIHEGEVRREGEEVARRVDVRVVLATHRDPTQMVGSGNLRPDLHAALRDSILTVPPLRERREDILPLARIFARIFARRYDTPEPALEADVGPALWLHPWRGNVRELQSAVESAVLKRGGAPLRAADF